MCNACYDAERDAAAAAAALAEAAAVAVDARLAAARAAATHCAACGCVMAQFSRARYQFDMSPQPWTRCDACYFSRN